LVLTEVTEDAEAEEEDMGRLLSDPNPFFPSDLCVLCALCENQAIYRPKRTASARGSARVAQASAGAWASSSATECMPVATATHMAPIAWAAAMSLGVSPTTTTRQA